MIKSTITSMTMLSDCNYGQPAIREQEFISEAKLAHHLIQAFQNNVQGMNDCINSIFSKQPVVIDRSVGNTIIIEEITL